MFELLSSERYSATTSRTFAERAGLNYAQLLDCQPTAKQVQTDHTLGNSLGVSGTPTVYVNGEAYVNSGAGYVNIGISAGGGAR